MASSNTVNQPSRPQDSTSDDSILNTTTNAVYSAGQGTKDTVEKGVAYLQETVFGSSGATQQPQQGSSQQSQQGDISKKTLQDQQAVDDMSHEDVEDFIRGKYHSKAGDGLPLADKAEGK